MYARHNNPVGILVVILLAILFWYLFGIVGLLVLLLLALFIF